MHTNTVFVQGIIYIAGQWFKITKVLNSCFLVKRCISCSCKLPYNSKHNTNEPFLEKKVFINASTANKCLKNVDCMRWVYRWFFTILVLIHIQIWQYLQKEFVKLISLFYQNSSVDKSENIIFRHPKDLLLLSDAGYPMKIKVVKKYLAVVVFSILVILLF